MRPPPRTCLHQASGAPETKALSDIMENHGQKRTVSEQADILEGVKVVLLDIEGTTTPISFVQVGYFLCFRPINISPAVLSNSPHLLARLLQIYYLPREDLSAYIVCHLFLSSCIKLMAWQQFAPKQCNRVGIVFATWKGVQK